MLTFCVVTTVRCNLRCTYCYNDTHSNSVSFVPLAARAPRVFTRDLVARCVSDLAAHGVEMLVLTGGEPFVAPSTQLWIEESARSGMELRVISNATVLSDASLEALASHPSVTVSVSIGGATIDQHNRDRGQWDATLAGIKRLAKAGVPFQLSFVLTKASLGDIAGVAGLAREYGTIARVAALAPGHDVASLDHLSLRSVRTEDWEREINACDDVDLTRDLAVVAAHYRGGLSVKYCAMRTRSQVMEPDGNVYGCFFRSDIKYGNVFESALSEILSRIDTKRLLDAPCFGDHCLTMQFH